MNVLRKGYDYFIGHPQRDADKRFNCHICGAQCLKSDAFGPIDFASAQAGEIIWHEKHQCPHADKAWHEQAFQLLNALENEPSPKIAAVRRKELQHWIAKHR